MNYIETPKLSEQKPRKVMLIETPKLTYTETPTLSI